VRVLLDEQMPRDLVAELASHEVRTVGQMGWKGLENGALLTAAASRFEVVITMDKRFAISRDIATSGVAILLVRATSNRIEALRPLVPAILAALPELHPGEVRSVGA
jgi:hypothetical protein